jgi:outer membrane protein OmpA-like peptidoglycan-associated protein
MNKYPKMKIMVIGHTDNQGDPEFNRQLSEMRAHFLVNKLIEYGVEASRLDWKGYGMDKPIASNDTEEGRKKNRRIEFKIMHK